MGKIPGGILGKVQGKVGGIIGQTWKGISYIKGYTIPADPKTAAQLVQRSKMQLCVFIARLILTSVVQPFWDPSAVKRSGFNDFISHNIKLIADDTDYENLQITVGPLETPGVPYPTTPAYYNTATGNLTVAYDDTIYGNGLASDLIGVVCFDILNKVSYSSIGNVTRENAEDELQIGLGHVSANLHCFVFAYRDTGETLEISVSNYTNVEDE